MTLLWRCGGAALLVLLTIPCPVTAQSLGMRLSHLSESKSDTAKWNALTDLLNRGHRDNFAVCSSNADAQIKRTLIRALEKENGVIYSAAAGSLSETESEYYANLIGCVASLRDPSALRGLIGAIETGGGAINGIVVLGEAAVPDVLPLLNSTGSRGHFEAIIAAGKLASRNAFPQSRDPSPQLSVENLAAIRVGLLNALADKDRFARMTAVEALLSYSDPQVKRAIQAIAASDPATTEPRRGVKDYPVRRAALDWLKQDSIKARKAPH